MRVAHISVVLALLVCTACSNYEEQRKLESTLTKSVNHFHEQLNNEQFHDIYSEADSGLRQRIDEPAFTNQLRSAHDQLGKIAGETKVLLTGRALNDLWWAKTFGRRQVIIHAEWPNSELINASEKFEWTIENDQPRLAAYEFRFICRKPCTVGISIP